MGTYLTISVAAGDESIGFQAIGAAFDSVRAYEALLSTWREESALGDLNRADVGAWVTLPSRLIELLSVTRSWWRETGGAFDPAIGALIDAWDLRGGGRVPDDSRLVRARAATGWGRFEFSAAGSTARRLAEGAWIDAGAFGKGAALAAAAQALHAGGSSSGILNFGGQVLVLDPTPGRAISIADPRARDRSVASILVANASAATSNQSERSLIVDGKPRGHLLDPRTGQPVEPWGSVTVVHADPLVADILATALFVLGPRDGPLWAETHGIAALFLVIGPETLHIECTRALRPHIQEESACLCNRNC